jgi:hypothetical protein
MRKVGLLMLALLAPSVAMAQEVRVGSALVLVAQASIIVRNDRAVRPLKNAAREFKYGEMCQAKPGGTLEVKSLNKDQNEYLVKYSAPGEQYGDDCPYGTLTTMKPEEAIELFGEQGSCPKP